MKYIKEHKVTVFVVILFIIIMIILFKLSSIFMGNNGKGIYGNRLDSISNVPISDSLKGEIKSNISSSNITKNVDVFVKGKIINVIITCNQDVSSFDAKGLSDKVVDSLNDEEKKLYDVQIFIKKSKDDASFPIIGYRHRNKDGFSWTSDR